jgi:hypothetical protein
MVTGRMIMIGDMFNQGLKHRVDALCREIANLLRSQPSLNHPDASHSQSQRQSGGYAGVELPSSGRIKPSASGPRVDDSAIGRSQPHSRDRVEPRVGPSHDQRVREDCL